MNESKVVQLCKNITKKTALKKLVLNELNLNLDDIEKIKEGLEEIRVQLEKQKQDSEQKQEKVRKAISELVSEGIDINELRQYLGVQKTVKKVRKTAENKKTEIKSDSENLKSVTNLSNVS